MKQLLLLLFFSFSFTALSQLDSIRLRTIEAQYGEQWDFCTCVVKNDSINKAFIQDDLTDEAFNQLAARSEQIEQKCMAFLAAYQLNTPEARAQHEHRVNQCLQNEAVTASVNEIRISFTDVASRAPISQLTFIISHEGDTAIYHEIEGGTLDLKLDFAGAYQTTVIKAGYDTLQLAFENPKEPAEQLLEFYLPRTDLTKAEKKAAHEYSLKLPERADETSGGFKRIRVSKKEFCVVRYRAYQEGSSHTSYEFRR